MEQTILDGKKYALELQENLKHRISKLTKMPVLASIIIGNDSASHTYVNMKLKKCEQIGITGIKIELDENVLLDELLNTIEKLNNDDAISGIMIQHPLPKHLNESIAFNKISISKDVDGLSSLTLGLIANNEPSFKPATPLAVIDLLKYYNIDLHAKNVVVIGRSRILGKPLALMLINENATVTVCHSKTKNLKEITNRADILISAVGKNNFITSDYIKNGAIVVDCGYNNNRGDVHEECYSKCSAYSPVPGGVGPVTIMKLLEQVVLAAERE